MIKLNKKMRNILLQQRQERDYLASKTYLKRHVEMNIDDYLKSNLIKVIIGPRRAGKSVFGLQMLQGTNYEKIIGEVSMLLDDEAAYEKMSKAVNPYGDGKACERIVNYLAQI